MGQKQIPHVDDVGFKESQNTDFKTVSDDLNTISVFV